MKADAPPAAMRTPALLLALAASSPAYAQTGGADPPERERTLIVYGDDPCPPSTGDEVVICARRPDDERFRIPEELRRSSDPPELGGISRVEALEESQRDTRPGSCSVVGSFGHTGCTQEMIRQWYADRRARRTRR
jgi:hypothetical protein